MSSSVLPPCAVSVVIPAYRVTDYIAEAIESVLAQTFHDFEIIVVNDGCPDTAALEQALQPYETKILYLKQEKNAGPSATRNAGIRAARGDFIAFLDADDIYEPEYLAVQLQMLRAHPTADMVYGSSLIFGDDPCVGMPIEAFRPSHGPVTTVSLLLGKVTVSLMSVVRREMLFRAGLFDETIRKCEDFDLWLRMTKLGGRIIYHSQPIAHYRVRGDSASADPIEMGQYLMMVGAKFERESDLTAEEAAALAEARLQWTAESDLERGRRSFRQGDLREAADRLRRANRYFRRRKLWAAATALTWAPGLVNVAMSCRNALFPARTVARGTR